VRSSNGVFALAALVVDEAEAAELGLLEPELIALEPGPPALEPAVLEFEKRALDPAPVVLEPEPGVLGPTPVPDSSEAGIAVVTDPEDTMIDTGTTSVE